MRYTQYIWNGSYINTAAMATSIRCYSLRHVEFKPSATRKVSQRNSNSFLVHSNRTVKVTGRSTVLSIHLANRLRLQNWH